MACEKKRPTIVEGLFLGLMAAYIACFCYNLKDRWFNPQWATDDSLQQAFPFHAVHYPKIFQGDLIFEMMSHYLAPLHYWLGHIFTWASGNPIMTGHWLMLAQILFCMIPLFLLVRGWTTLVPAAVSVIWLFHTRHVMQRITAGLQRGWAPGLLTLSLYFLMKRSHKGVFFAIFLACVLHPPSALIIIGVYWLVLLMRLVSGETRAWAKQGLVIFLLLHPVYFGLAHHATTKPPHLGTMVTYQEATERPEFWRPDGRFPIVPLSDPWHEIKNFGFQAFTSIFYNPGREIKAAVPYLVVALLALLLLYQIARKRNLIPPELWAYLISCLTTYYLARLFAFKLFIPDRYIQIPFAIFFVSAVPIAMWRLCERQPQKISENSDEDGEAPRSRCPLPRWLCLAFGQLLILAIVFGLSGTGLYGDANFNTSEFKYGHLYPWIRKHTPERALFAGHPDRIELMQLYGRRKALVTTETAHPFYDKYFEEMLRRLKISLRAYYSRDLSELVDLVEPEGVDFFIFQRKDFYPEALQNAKYFQPLQPLVKELTSRHYDNYAYKQLPRQVNLEEFPFMPFRNEESVVVDIERLKQWLAQDRRAIASHN